MKARLQQDVIETQTMTRDGYRIIIKILDLKKMKYYTIPKKKHDRYTPKTYRRTKPLKQKRQGTRIHPNKSHPDDIKENRNQAPILSSVKLSYTR